MPVVRLLFGFLLVSIVPAPAVRAQAGSLTNADSVALLTAIYGTALNNGLRTAHANERPSLVCVDGLSGPILDAVLLALRDSTSRLLRSAVGCRVEPLRGTRDGKALVVDTLTGARGILIRANLTTVADDGTFAFRTSYYENGLSGGDWDCTGERRGKVWAVTFCRLTRIS